MTLREELSECAPRLRRYVRALATGSPAGSALADDIVQAALMRALGARQLGSPADLMTRLYATVTQLHRETAEAGRRMHAAGAARPALVAGSLAPALARKSRLTVALMSLSLEDREALLLVTLEGLDHSEAARILRISRSALLARLSSARRALDLQLKAQSPTAAPRPRSAPHLRLVT